MTMHFGFQAAARRDYSVALPEAQVASFEDRFDVTLSGQVMWSVVDSTDTKKTFYLAGSEVIGRVFRSGIHTVAELELAQTLGGLRPESVPACDAFGVRYLFESAVDAIVNGTSAVVKLVKGDAAALKALWLDAQGFTKGVPSTPEWIARARAFQLVVTLQLVNLDPLMDRAMIAFDAARIIKRNGDPIAVENAKRFLASSPKAAKAAVAAEADASF